MSSVENPYTQEELIALYELGRMYFEMGYFAPAERIFNGLSEIDGGFTPARIGIGLVKLERGQHAEALNHFRAALQQGRFPLHAQLALTSSFIATGEVARAKSSLAQVAAEMEKSSTDFPELRALWGAFAKAADA